MLHSSLVEKCPRGGGGWERGGGVCAYRISVENPQVFLPSPRRHPPERRAWGIPGAVLGPAAPLGGTQRLLLSLETGGLTLPLWGWLWAGGTRRGSGIHFGGVRSALCAAGTELRSGT